jgi:GT2 family glycosyltransferase
VTVGVVIVTWNSARFLADCLQSLRAQTHPVAHLVVVDNGSADDSVARARAGFPEAEVIELGTNTGYCTANNIGIARAGGEIVLLLNSDIILDARYVERAVAAFASDERIGAVQGKLLRFDGKTLDTAGQALTRGRRVRERGYGEPDRGQYDAGGPVWSVCCAAAFYRRRTIEDISVQGQFFDETFFAFGEDLDAGWRARNAGWVAWYEPAALARHFRGGSSDATAADRPRARFAILDRPPALRLHILKNRALTLLKNDRPSSWLLDWPWMLAQDAVQAAAAVAMSPAVALRWIGSARLWPAALRRRREFFAKRGVWGERRAASPRDGTARA